ncbi:MAG: hypothetical protein LBH25_10590 [Fibromonadaceae bacterium]|jgi:hypothetical protein|nr:hypothetical protein [Fibromonadaceae bacterium]
MRNKLNRKGVAGYASTVAAAFGLAIAFTLLLLGCTSSGSDTIALPELELGGTEGKVPDSVIPSTVRDKVKGSMPIYSGTTPPDISGQYMADNLTCTERNKEQANRRAIM